MLIHISDLFDLQKIADSGQCFRAARLGEDTYRFITGDQVLYIRQVSGRTYEADCPAEAWENVWSPYFDLGRNYQNITAAIPPDDVFLSLSARDGAGIRILRQDPWETLITFIISQRKSIPAIRSVVELLCRRYGTELRTSRETLYTFPTAWQLREVSIEDYAACKAGYRAPYIYDAVQKVLSGSFDLAGSAALSDGELLSALEEIRGVGVKVANCVALFAYGRTACAPVDTWIRKIIRWEYHGETPFGRYGAEAGIMQQYFFYYAQRHRMQPRQPLL